MRIGSVDFPYRLIDAAIEGKLVLFCGAGVSVPAPTWLPSFKGLVADIEAIAPFTREKDGDEPSDRFFGRLEEGGFAVRSEVERILERSDAKSNELHKGLVNLVPDDQSIRIVTTNFDRHFEAPLADRVGKEFEIYRAPALPVGSKFNGLVYLHGRLADDASSMVLTDADFGRAYLTEGWARRFLGELFGKYTILFVGYSHDDTVTQYLARGLPPEAQYGRYALTGNDDVEHWRFLGIEPLQYDPGDDHRELPEAITSWVDLLHRGALDTERRVRDLVGRDPESATVPEEEELIWLLREHKTAQYFYEHATSTEWLRWWADHRDEFPTPFDEDASEIEENLLRRMLGWFPREPLSKRGETALTLLLDRGLEVSWGLRNAVASALWSSLREVGKEDRTLTDEEQRRFVLWINCVCRKFDKGENGESYWLDDLDVEVHPDLALIIFKHITQPYLRYRRRPVYNPDDTERERLHGEIELRGDQHYLEIGLNKVSEALLAEHSDRVLEIAVGHLDDAYRLLEGIFQASPEGDMVSRLRSAIEPHPQDEMPHSTDVLIDAARNALDHQLEKNEVQAAATIERLLNCGAPLLLRLGIYGLTRSTSSSSAQKLSRLMKERWLERVALHHEVFHLLRKAYPDASASMRERLLRHGRTIYRELEEALGNRSAGRPVAAYELFNLLVWLEDADPECPFVEENLEKIKADHPDFERREYQDLTSWEGEVQTGFRSPLTQDEFCSLSPEALLRKVKELREGGATPLDVFGLEGLFQEASVAFSSDFECGQRLAEHLVKEEFWDSEFWPSLIRGWGDRTLTVEEWSWVVGLLEGHLELLAYGESISELLSRRMESKDTTATEEMVLRAIPLAERLWESAHETDDVSDIEVGGWLGRAINRGQGKLGLFVMRGLSILNKVRSKEPDERQLAVEFMPLLTAMAASDEDQSPYARIVLCSQLHFLFYLDGKWTEEHLFPLFDWEHDELTATQSWQGFLTWSRPTPALLDRFMPCFQQVFAHTESLGNLRRRLANFILRIIYSRAESPLAQDWFTAFLKEGQSEDRELLAEEVSILLRDLDRDEQSALWDQWLKKYMDHRLRGNPPLENKEWRTLAGWSIYLGGRLPEVVELIERRQIPYSQHGRPYYEMARTETLLEHPQALTRVLLHFLQGERQTFWDCRDVAEIVRKLAGHAVPAEELRPIIERYRELGCTDAEELLREIT